MSTTVATPVTAPPRAASSRPRRVKGRRNYLGGFFGWVWLAIIIIPVYYIVVTTFKDQGAYFTQNPLALPNPPTLTAYQRWWRPGSSATSSTRSSSRSAQ
jgi:raffinose/stachyose/melibiose transport system permease protein